MLHQPARFGRRLALSGACTLVLGGCFGSFGAVCALWDWNDGVSDNKWLKWLVFLGLSIIPVYLLFAMADSLVINSIEFWTGSNPIKNGSDGRSVTRVATADPNLLRLEIRRHGDLEGVVYCRRLADGGIELRDASGTLLSHVHEHADGSLELRGGDRTPLARLDAAALQLELGARDWQMARQSGLGTPELL
jgi:Domain of unknown function (DUF3332)